MPLREALQNVANKVMPLREALQNLPTTAP